LIPFIEEPELIPFDPFKYYLEDVKNCVNKNLPYIELFKSVEGLHEQDLICKTIKEDFKIIPNLKQKWNNIKLYFKQKGLNIGSEITARLYKYEVDTINNKLILTFQKAEYWMAHVTNFNLDYKFKDWDRRLRDIVAPGPRIEPLERSNCANHLGLGCILVMEDDKIVLQHRSSNVAVYSNLIGPSASGALGWEMRLFDEAFPSPFIGMRSEILSELGIRFENIKDMRLLALCRDLIWGGKPTAIFVVYTHLDSKTVAQLFDQKPEQYWETDKLEFIKSDDIERILKLMKRDDVALSTKACLFYYCKHTHQDLTCLSK